MPSSKMKIRQVKEIEVAGLGEKIKQARLDSGKSVEQICAEVGLSRTYWYDIEREMIRGTLSFENLQKIEKALNINLNVDFND